MSDLNPLSQDFTIKSLLKFAFPTILMMIFMGLYTVVDTIFVARFVDTNALSALNIVCPVINLIVGLGAMLATGGSAIVARKMGAGEHTRAAQDFTLIISVGILLGVFLASAFSKSYRNGGAPRNGYGAWHKRRNRKYFTGLYFYGAASHGH